MTDRLTYATVCAIRKTCEKRRKYGLKECGYGFADERKEAHDA